MKKPNGTRVIVLFIVVLANAYTGVASGQQESEWKQLFDPDLKHWEVFMGVPHTLPYNERLLMIAACGR